MRTRSQQQSPGNFVSLESTSRRTRSTRGASQTKAANVTNSTDPNPPEGEPSGPSKQPAARAKSQRVTTKKTATATRKKATRAAPNKAPAKATRKSTRKTTKATSQEPEAHEHESPETTPETDENKENLDEAVQNTEAENATAEQALAEKDDAQTFDPTISDLSPVGTIGASGPEFSFEDISDIGSPLSERSRTPSLDEPLFTDGEIDSILLEQIGAGQYVRPTEDSAWEQSEAPSTFESPAVARPTTAESMESVAVQGRDQQISQQPDSLSTSAVGSGGETVAVSEQAHNLAQDVTNLGLAGLVPRPAAVFSPGLPDGPTWQPETRDPTSASLTVGGGSSDYASQAAVSVAPVDLPGPSIFDEPPPRFDLPYIGEFARRQAQQTPSLISLAPRPYHDDLFSLYRARDVRRVLVPGALAGGRLPRPQFSPAAAREPVRRSQTGSLSARWSTRPLGSRPRVPAVLSPLPEQSESEMSPGLGGSKVGASAVSQAPMIPRKPSRCMDPPDRPPVSKKLTHKKVNRKRTRSVVSDEETAGGPETPIANKRRNLGAPGSTPFARRLPPLSRRLSSTSVPYSERLRRRRAERDGRIHRTVFRLPEYIAQEMADRQTAETAGQQSPCPEPPLSNVDALEEPEQAQDQNQDRPVENAPAEPTPGMPSALPSAQPETPRRGWNIRGLLNSVPRSFSRLIPGLGRSSAQTGQTEQSLPASNSETTKQPASERIDRTIDPEPEFTAAKAKFRPWKPRRRLTTDEPPQKRPRSLEYSLFPPPMDKSLYLGDIATPLRDLPEPSSLQPSSLQPTSSQPSTADARSHEPTTTASTIIASESTAQNENASASQAENTRGRETPQQASSKKQKKRKREPSPDVIPNPPGCSYGMDTDYFWYSSESEDESVTEAPEKSTAPQQAEGLARTAVRSALRSDRPSSKKVRFDASPEDTPSKLRTRARATDPYTGSHFIGMGSGSPSSSFAPPSPTPTAPTPAPLVEGEEDLLPASPITDPRTRPGFIPNTQGTFELNYDDFSDDETSEPSSPSSVSAPSPAPAAETQLDESVQSPAPSSPAPSATPRPTAAIPPSTPAAPVDEEALAKVRSLAEKHKPKTPSRLRTASRYSSPMTITAEARIESLPVEDFGDDEFAQDAQWLYEKCPSGDLTQFQWPARQGYQESLGISQAAIDVVAQVWNNSEVDEAYDLFKQGFEQFKQEA